MCLSILPICTCLPGASGGQKQKNVGSPRTGVTDACELPCHQLGLELGRSHSALNC